ncbi:DUF5004 domain-containing protein [Paenimyroides baculatum]|uniref:DUF5004 domain-containing protein n=1 Tax=Paenimyroides baculatum TaxID=2608000 RepID=A0A5M6CMV8_9FLAO|nr:DUF5004 domain-containing protein [Paenimyroides baculatum]KAA5535730.1 DUF5004 domain-containing protein [Paenimyroides baculatum]
MKTIVLLFMTLFLTAGTVTAQTSKELVGKWQLVKWTHNNKEKDIKDYFKTDQVYQIFMEDGKFDSKIGDELHHGKWSLSKDNKELVIKNALIPVKFQIDYFTAEKRIMTYPQLGSFEYKKITE